MVYNFSDNTDAISVVELANSVALNVLATVNLASHHVIERDLLHAGSTYDYIVIGGGTAGCVVASRLTEDPNITVALLEAGPQQPIESVLPGLFPTLPGTSYDYNFRTEQDSYTAQLLEGKVPMITAGRMLSGTSGLDSLYHIRSNRYDYQRWVDVTGDDSWGYDEMLKYYIKSERLEDQGILNSSDSQYHGLDGPVGISRQTFEANEVIFKAFEELGIKSLLDVNDEATIGVFEPILQVSNGIRQSTSEAYLIPAKDRENLYIYTLTPATKIIFDENNNAIGVEAINTVNETVTINARKEVIVSVGGMKSAQILIMSGIGSSEDLESWGLPIISALPVGMSIRDQVGAVVAYKLKPTDKPVENLDPMKFPVPVSVVFKSIDADAKYPDYQATNFYFPKNSLTLVSICYNKFRYIDAVCDRFIEANQEGDLFFSSITHLHPFSTGQVAITSLDPLHDPWIYMGTFKDPRDAKTLGKFMYDFVGIAETETFKELEAELVEIDLEYCNDEDRDSYEYWRCYGRSMSALMGHPSGSCPLGTVLDSQLRVIGVQRLRVVDSAAMPNLNTGELTPDVIALAEKAADLIKADQSLF